MVNKNQLFKKVWTFVVIAIFLLPSSSLLAEISAVELLSSLSQKDRMSNANGYKISLVTSSKANPSEPNQGMVFQNCEATWTKEGSFAMKIVSHYEKDLPVFVPRESRRYKSLEYDHDGNLVLWRSSQKFILSAPDRDEIIEVLKGFRISPNGEILNMNDHTQLYRWPIGSRNSMYQFKQFQLATGKGFSGHIGTVTSIKSLPSGLTKVNSQGSYGSGLQGGWELILDPNSDYLVREAIFTMKGMDRPTIVVKSSGVIEKDGIKNAKYGTFKFSNVLELSVEVTDISKVVGPNKLYEEVLSRLNSPLPQGSSIVDLRGDKPVRTTVK
jgi:hypothetical protein